MFCFSSYYLILLILINSHQIYLFIVIFPLSFNYLMSFCSVNFQNNRDVPPSFFTYKILEHIIYDQILSNAEKIVGAYQCGFRRQKSTINQVNSILLTLFKKPSLKWNAESKSETKHSNLSSPKLDYVKKIRFQASSSTLIWNKKLGTQELIIKIQSLMAQSSF